MTVRFVRNPAAAGEEPGTVVAQTPAPLDPIEIGGVVTAALAEKVDEVVVPRVMSTSYDHVGVEQAITRLRAQRFRVVVADGAEGRRSAGHGHRPGPGPGRAGRSGLDRRRSSSPARTPTASRCPTYGPARSTARERLEQAGLGVRARRDGGTPRDDDVVYTMDPDIGSIVPPETVVQLITDSRTVANAAAARSGN